jgi:general secretion pathway protein A
MYTQHFGLTAKPFSLTPNPDALFQSSHHSMALTYLEYGLREKLGFILLTGEAGTGKTTLLRSILRTIKNEIETAEIFNTNVSSGELIRLIMQEFSVESAGADKTENLHRLNHFLIDKYAQDKRCLLVIDEAQNLSREAMEEVRMLSNLSTETDILLQIILAGQSELNQILNQPNMRQLAQRISVAYHLEALDAAETEGYIQYRLSLVGDGDRRLFSKDAMQLVHDHSSGIPRMINIISDAALLYAFADDKAQVDGEIVKQVIHDRHELWQPQDQAEPPSQSRLDEVIAQIEHLAGRVKVLENKNQVHDRDFLNLTIRELMSEIEQERIRSDKLSRAYTYWRQKALQLGAECGLGNGLKPEGSTSYAEADDELHSFVPEDKPHFKTLKSY